MLDKILPLHYGPTKSQCEQFVRDCCRHIGAGFHPDSKMSDYVTGEPPRPLFTVREAMILQRSLDRCFRDLDDVYEVAYAEFVRLGYLKPEECRVSRNSQNSSRPIIAGNAQEDRGVIRGQE